MSYYFWVAHTQVGHIKSGVVEALSPQDAYAKASGAAARLGGSFVVTKLEKIS